MISETRLRTIARQDNIAAGLAEKNYVNSWVLYAISTSPLTDVLVFKGGTALSKLYFPEIWRFSEDLDFTVLPGRTIQRGSVNEQLEIREPLNAGLNDIEPGSGIDFGVTNYHTAGDPIGYVQIDVQYDAVLGQKNTTRLDITLDEPLVFPAVEHRHSFEDVPEFSIVAYSVEEVFAEKLRSLFQRARARDYYDIYRLLQQESFDDPEIVEAFRAKCRARDIDPDLENGLPKGDIDDVQAYWDRALNRLVRESLPFEEVVDRIDRYLKQLAALDD